MDFLTTFETDSHKVDMIPIFFHSRGYKLEGKVPDSYTFKRGGGWTSAYSLDAKKWATRVEVSLKKLGKNRVRVSVGYHIETKAIVTTLQRNKVTVEVEALEKFVGSGTSRALTGKG